MLTFHDLSANARNDRQLCLNDMVLFLCGTLLCFSVQAELIFGAPTGEPANPGIQVFRAVGGDVTQVNSGLPAPTFPSLSPDGRQLLMSSIDPAQPNEASQDLFALELQSGQLRKLVDNVTQPDPEGGFMFATPLWSAMSSNGTRVAFVNQIANTTNDPLSGSVRQLNVIQGSDGFPVGLAEIGFGNALDLFQSEFVGISFFPGSDYFATPAYVEIVNNLGQPLLAAGIVMFGPEGPPGQPYVRTAVLTMPTAVVNSPFGNVISLHAYPAFSPDGSQLAFFRITYPSASLSAPAQTDLIVISTDTGSGSVLASFEAGWVPAGVSWRGGANLVFSLGVQINQGGVFLPNFEPFNAQIFTIPAQGGSLGGVSGVTLGMFPNSSPRIFRSRFE